MTLYEDAFVVVELASEPAAHGHVIVRPVKPAKHLAELSAEESAHLFTVASYTAAILFQGLQAEGTNIICNEDEEQLAVHIIARTSTDGLSFQWEPLTLDQGMMTEAMERIKNQAYTIAVKSASEQQKPSSDKPAPSSEQPKGAPVHASEKEARVRKAEESENQLIKQLLRIP